MMPSMCVCVIRSSCNFQRHLVSFSEQIHEVQITFFSPDPVIFLQSVCALLHLGKIFEVGISENLQEHAKYLNLNIVEQVSEQLLPAFSVKPYIVICSQGLFMCHMHVCLFSRLVHASQQSQFMSMNWLVHLPGYSLICKLYNKSLPFFVLFFSRNDMEFQISLENRSCENVHCSIILCSAIQLRLSLLFFQHAWHFVYLIKCNCSLK